LVDATGMPTASSVGFGEGIKDCWLDSLSKMSDGDEHTAYRALVTADLI
jgi:hypothetical protein